LPLVLRASISVDRRAGQARPLQTSTGQYTGFPRKILIAGFRTELCQARMVQAIAADEIDYEEHEQRAENHNGYSDLKAELKVAGVRDFPYQLRS